ncbi:hypothetical protein M1293_00610 [Candidatus Parvarchaeota archaeon]|nr:hypothetical protein [Candidatus Parvarchaeota archaeon]
MKSQFSVEFLIDVSIVLVLVAFLAAFFLSLSNTQQNAVYMNGVCSVIAQAINSVSNSVSPYTAVNLPISSISTSNNLNVTISNGIIITFLLINGKPASNLLANTNVVSCGADTRLTANESFLLSSLYIYKNSDIIDLAYLYANYSTSLEPQEIFGGGFSSNVTLFLDYPNGTASNIGNEYPTFSYNATSIVQTLNPGVYAFSAKQVSDPNVMVELLFSVK